jgi:hypothetical protein
MLGNGKGRRDLLVFVPAGTGRVFGLDELDPIELPAADVVGETGRSGMSEHIFRGPDSFRR